MRNVLICTVGTSLKGNLERAGDSICRDFLQKKNVKGIALELMRCRPEHRLLGAEINSISSIIEKGHITSRECIFLLISDTSDGDIIGCILKEYYEHHQNPHRFDAVECQAIKGLRGDSPQSFRTEGLRNLVRVISKIVQKHGSGNVLINATGGYKAQISFAGMIGQALEIPVCYLFEGFSEVIVLPPQPISMDLSFWLEHADVFFDLAADEAREDPSVADERFAALVDQIEVDGKTVIGLSPVGQLFHDAFRRRFHRQRERLLPPDSGKIPASKTIKYEDDNRGKHAGLAAYLGKVAKIPYVRRIYTHHYNPDLPLRNYFRPSNRGEFSQIEGGYSNGKAATKFDVVTTARTRAEREAAVVDLSEQLL